MIARTFNEQLNILEVIYNGQISYDELIEFGESFAKNKHLPRNLKMITDARKAEYTFSADKVSEIATHIEIHLKDYVHVKAAFVQTKPNETALSMVLENENKTNKYIHKVFCTRESALEWLMEA